MKEILITSSVLIGVLMLLRLMFAQKVSRKLIYGAWILVALRLLIPVQIGQLDFSVLTAARPLTETVEEVSGLRVMGQNEREADIQVTKDYIEQDRTVFVPEVQEYIESAIEKNETPEQIATAIIKTQGREEIYVEYVQAQVALQVQEQTDFVSLGQAAKILWLCGLGVMTLWFAVVNLRHSRNLRKSRNKLETDSPIPVYVSDAASSPCLVGLVRPAVYLTPASVADPKMLEHVVKHELTHYRHGDHIWALVRGLCLCIYWFDPLVWAAAYLSRRDCELACDEGAMRGMDAAERVSYGKTLLEVVSQAAGPVKLLQTATSMNENGKQLKERVCFIVKKPKLSITAAVCMVLLCAIVAGCAAAGASTTQPPQNPTTTTPTAPTSSTNADRQSTRIELSKQMNIWWNSPDIHLQCHYLVSKNSFQSGETISLTLHIKNLGKAIAYTGALENQIGSIQLWANNGEYVIQADTKPDTDDVTPQKFRHNEEATLVYQFVVPDSAREDSYTLGITAFGQQIRFDDEAAQEERYVPCLADLPEEAQKIVAGEYYASETQYFSYSKRAKRVPVYYEFEDVYVAFWNFDYYGDEFSKTSEEVNGLIFKYLGHYPIEVFTPGGVYTLTEAFNSGLLNAEQIQQIYDNYQLVGPLIDPQKYEPYMQVTELIEITHWEEMRLRYSCSTMYDRYYAGDQISVWVSISNMGPEASFYNIKDDISPTAWLISDETGQVIESAERDPSQLNHMSDGWITGLGVSVIYEFAIPEDFQEGTYTFVFKMGDREIRFDAKAAEEERNITILDKLPYQVLRTIFGKELQSGHFPDHMPVYGYFVGTYVYIFPSETADGDSTIEVVNGLEFEIPDGYALHVYSNMYGGFTLTEAFAAGILTAEQLREVYDNYIFLQNSSTTIKP